MNKKAKIFLLATLVLFNLFTGRIIYNYYVFTPEVDFLAVGQGDAELIKTSAGNILIDAGPGIKILSELARVLPVYDKTIDLVIITHPNKDHYNGLFYLLDRYNIRAVMLNNFNYYSKTYQKLLTELVKRKILLLLGYRGVRIRDAGTGIFQLTLLYPPKINFSPRDINRASLIADLLIKKNQFLFTGDTTKQEERLILQDLSFTPIRILKVAHHGSLTSTSEKLLQVFQPQVAVVEVGHNNYHLPRSEIIRRLTQEGIRIWRTDLQGTIRFFIEDFNKIKTRTRAKTL